MSCEGGRCATLTMTHESTPSEDSMDIPQLVDLAEDLVRVAGDHRKPVRPRGVRPRGGQRQQRPFTPSEPEEEITDYWDQVRAYEPSQP